MNIIITIEKDCFYSFLNVFNIRSFILCRYIRPYKANAWIWRLILITIHNRNTCFLKKHVTHLYNAIHKKTWQYICDHNSGKTRLIFRPHRSTTYVDAAYSYRPTSVVCRSVCLSVCHSVCHTSEPCKNGCTDRAAFWVEDLGGSGKPRIRWGPDPPWEGANFWGRMGVPL